MVSRRLACIHFSPRWNTAASPRALSGRILLFLRGIADSRSLCSSRLYGLHASRFMISCHWVKAKMIHTSTDAGEDGLAEIMGF